MPIKFNPRRGSIVLVSPHSNFLRISSRESKLYNSPCNNKSVKTIEFPAGFIKHAQFTSTFNRPRLSARLDVSITSKANGCGESGSLRIYMGSKVLV